MITLTQPHFWRPGAVNKPFGWSLLWLVSLVYAFIVRMRRATTKPAALPSRSICVGNAVAGGAGKTPVLLALARLLGPDHVVFITRGYGGTIRHPTLLNDTHGPDQCGDEAMLLRRLAPVIVGSDRVEAARLARELFPSQILLLDDGLQNPTFRAQINLLVWDDYGAGNGHCLPAGPLREPLQDCLARTDAVIVVNSSVAPKTPAFTATGSIAKPSDEAERAAIIGFAGIGRPEKFQESLENAGYVVAGFYPFPDHHVFTEVELQKLTSADLPVLTTEKDWVRLSPDWQKQITPIPYSVQISHPQNLLHWLQDHMK